MKDDARKLSYQKKEMMQESERQPQLNNKKKK